MKDRFANEGLTPAPGTPGDFAKVVRRDIEKWIKVVKDAKIKTTL
jgi:tripartite-type tricarboxylate transporter receptor subunit TctC